MVIPQTFSLGVEGLFYFFDKKKTLFDDTFSVAGLWVRPTLSPRQGSMTPGSSGRVPTSTSRTTPHQIGVQPVGLRKQPH
jgi:hypothetical protein